VYKEVEDSYGTNGHVSVPPPIILKLMLLLVFCNPPRRTRNGN
jgi:hypothetical protein